MGVIEIKNMSKYYGNFCALKDISLKIEPNKIYGLLGRNGAGKTTLLNLINNRLFPTEGEITIDGEGVLENDKAIGKMFYMTEKDLYPEAMKVGKAFVWTKEFYPSFDMEYAMALSKKFSLNTKKKIKALSTGQNSIMKLIITLASNAEVLMFDEPILGLDANHRELFYKELLQNFIEKPKTIILSTHIIEEISDILERVIIIKDKVIAVDDSVETLLEKAYSVAGAANKVDEFIKDKNPINTEVLGSFKSATILGELTAKDRETINSFELEINKVELQKLFIHLTNEGGN
ncbi:ABC transporter ATP-binding protein [Clostridium sp. UBA4548]|uniref:ABC transporter ATP-binding protein n=1 Tax=Clostridium sp. UBA4548 TaxID=1946361 RepID=UPI0025BA4628|nr:ABC transporter ATP-binding protein [Clostridium sp. UBA4548]